MRSGVSPMRPERTTRPARRIGGTAAERREAPRAGRALLRRQACRPQSLAMAAPGVPLYSSPEIYEVAFGWDLTRELDFYERAFRAHAPDRVRRVLEPCCGTGRMLEGLARRGYEAF